MKQRFAVMAILLLASAGACLLSLSLAQEVRPAPPGPIVVSPPSTSALPPRAAPATAPSTAPKAIHDLSKLSPLQKQIYLSANRGGRWLYRMNTVKGRFANGWLPALDAPMDGDHPLRQAGAAFALARAARFFHDEDMTARAKQAVLMLFADTVVDSNNREVRYSALPAPVANRLSAAAVLTLAVYELPTPSDELTGMAEQLCNYIRLQQQQDGSLNCVERPAGAKVEAGDLDGIDHYAGQALYALLRSQSRKPAAWKIEVARKSLPYYVRWWREHQNRELTSWLTAAYSEAFLLTKDRVFADAVLEMNDWLCGLQYDRLEANRPQWLGGFRDVSRGKTTETAPDISSAICAASLADACRVTRQLGDLQRHERYSAAVERCLQFVTTLQYTEADTQHFADWYRPRLVGGFRAGLQEGNLRIDQTQHAVSALVEYLMYVAGIV